MYIQVDFGRSQTLDEVDVDTSADYPKIRLQVVAANGDGSWVTIGSNPEIRTITVPSEIRRWATRDIHNHGLDYILMRDSDWGAEDMREDPESWGLLEIAKGFGARIYKIKGF